MKCKYYVKEFSSGLRVVYDPIFEEWVSKIGDSFTTINNHLRLPSLEEWAEVCDEVGLTLDKKSNTEYEVTMK